jgi:hypothetical protein
LLACQDGFLLQSATVGHRAAAVDKSCLVPPIGKRRADDDVRRHGLACLVEAAFGARMKRPQERLATFHEGFENRLQALRVVGIGGPMKREKPIVAGLDAVGLRKGCVRSGAGLQAAEEVNHHVPHQVNTARDSLVLKVLDCCRGGAIESLRYVVGQDPVDLFGHGAITAAQSRLDVGHRDVEFGCCKCSGQGRIGIAVEQHAIREALDKQAFNLGEHLGRLLPVGS